MSVLTAKQPLRPSSLVRSGSNPILIEIEQIGDVCFLRFKGCFSTGGYSDYLDAKMDQIKTLASKKVLADLDDVVSIGSVGLSFIIGLYRASEGRLVLVRTQPRVHKVLDITRLSTVIPLAADIDSGLAELHGDCSAARSPGTS